MIPVADLYVQGKMSWTQKQIARAVDETTGGWPANAEFLMMFDSRVDSTTLYFADKDTKSLCVKGRKYTKKWFKQAMTRDQYYFLRLSADGYRKIQQNIIDRIVLTPTLKKDRIRRR